MRLYEMIDEGCGALLIADHQAGATGARLSHGYDRQVRTVFEVGEQLVDRERRRNDARGQDDAVYVSSNSS